ncbi:MAG: pyridoxamine 5'-phosphate oxidase family protein [Saprospiraceae bacterium]|nr:pyridoxamine 5'-phosphate oxidase family protein [Saprospiraceae bacterium]
MLTTQEKDTIDRCVLCWLATSNLENEPNVSPKEMFTYQDDSTLLIAHIASPISIRNINQNPNVCVSMVDVFTQKGTKLKGTARIIEKDDASYRDKVTILTDLFSDGFPIQAVIEVTIQKVAQIIAPSYYLVEGTTEKSQVDAAMKTYGVQPKK